MIGLSPREIKRMIAHFSAPRPLNLRSATRLFAQCAETRELGPEKFRGARPPEVQTAALERRSKIELSRLTAGLTSTILGARFGQASARANRIRKERER